jgi:hypothetical protein
MEIIVTDLEDVLYIRSVMDSYQYYPKELKIMQMNNIGNLNWKMWKDILFPTSMVSKTIIQNTNETKNVSQNLSFYLQQTKSRNLKIRTSPQSTNLILFLHPFQTFSQWNQIPKDIQIIHIFGNSETPLLIPYQQLLPTMIQDHRQSQFWDRIHHYPSIFQRLLQTPSSFSINWIPFDQKTEKKSERMWEYLNRLFQRETISSNSSIQTISPKIPQKEEVKPIILDLNRSIDEEYKILNQLPPSEKLSYYQRVIELKLRAKPIEIIKKEEVKKRVQMEKEYLIPFQEYAIFTFLWTLSQTQYSDERPSKIFLSKPKFTHLEHSNSLFADFIKKRVLKKIEEMEISTEWIREEDTKTKWEGKVENKNHLTKWREWIGMKDREIEHSVYYIWMDDLKEIPSFMWEKREKIILLKNQEKNEVIEEMKKMREFDILDLGFLKRYHGFVSDSYFEIAERELNLIVKAKAIYGYKKGKNSFYDFCMELR